MNELPEFLFLQYNLEAAILDEMILTYDCDNFDVLQSNKTT
jgi:hypothetical protein